MSAADVLVLFSTISGFLPVAAALINYKNLDTVLKIAVVYFLVSVMSDMVLQFMRSSGVANNWPVIHIYIAVSAGLLGAMYYFAFFSPALKKLILGITVFCLVFIVTNMVTIEGIFDYPSLSNTILSFMVIVFSLLYFYQLLTRQEFVHIEKQGLFWINAGMLFYFSITIFLFMLFKRMLNAHQEGYYTINNITNITSNILFSIGLLCKPQKQKVTSSRY